MSDLHQRPLCSVCGLPLPQGELAARCPHCLLSLALDDSADESGASPTPGKRERARPRYFADFELLEKLADGGMGIVWKARQLGMNRTVALKMIHAGHLASAEARVRFAAEIDATARLDHPHIVPLFATGEHEGVHYFTMKLLEGGDLSARRRDLGLCNPGHPPPSHRDLWEKQIQLTRLLVKIARAVHYAHLRGILHRDLKPSNVLLDEAGEPHVSDFGLAKILTRECGFTFTQSVLGSPNYMAPEQAPGRTDELTTATDVYGIGAIFYELLTGRPPFQADSPIATLRQVLDHPPTPPRKLNPAIDADLETVCLKCLEKLPSARYASAEALAEDLERWLDQRPILARRATALEHAWRWCRREPALATALAACLALLLAVAFGSTVAAWRIHQAEQSAMAALREAQLSQARSLRLQSDIGHREEGLRLLRAASAPGASDALRQLARDEMLAMLVRTDLQFSNLPALRPVRDPALNLVDASFTKLATVGASNTIIIQSLPDGREQNRFPAGASPVIRLEQFSHDARFVGLRHPDGISIWDTVTGQRSWGTNGPQRVFCFAPDQSLAVVEEWDYQAAVLELPGLRLVQTIQGSPPGNPGRVRGWSAMALSPENRTLVVSRGQDRVMEWISLTNGEAFRLVTNRAPVVALAWRRDGTALAASLSNGRVPVFNQRGSKFFELPAMPAVGQNLAFNPDGSLLAVQCQDRVLRLIDTQAMRYAFEAACDGGAVTFDQSGARLGWVFRGDQFGWFALKQPAEFQHKTVASTRTEFNGCQFSPDGRMVAVGNLQTVVFCDALNPGRLASRSGWRMSATAFDPTTNFVLAANYTGLFRWRAERDQDGRLHLLNEDHLFKGRGWRSFTFNLDGTRFLAANIHSNAAFIFDRTFTNCLATLGPHVAPDSVAISPDGRWAATGSTTDRHVRVWNTTSNVLQLELPTGPEPQATFSRDGHWFASFGDTFTLHEVGSWTAAPPLPVPDNRPNLGAAAFSPDGRLLAVVCNLYTIQLIDLQNYRPLGLLRSPSPVVLHSIQFSPDSRQIAGAGTLGRLLLWDLRQLRTRLREYALDWDWPASTAVGRGR